MGVAPGERQLMIVRDCIEWFPMFWGAIKAGVVPEPVNTMLRAKDYTYMIEDSGAALVVWSDDFAAEVEPAAAAAAHKPDHLLRVGDAMTRLDAAGPVEDFHPSRAEDDCFWLYSSGSTGFPKGAVHLQRDMVVTSYRYAQQTMGMTADDLHYSAAKLFFAYGLGNANSFPLWLGGKVLLSAPRPTPDATFTLIEKYQPTVYYGVPTLYNAICAAFAEQDPDWSSVRLAVSAGEALPAEILRRFEEKTGVRPMDGWGSTEQLHIVLSNRAGDGKAGTSGRLIPGYETRIVGEDGQEVPYGEAGVLHIRGQSGARTYWNKPEKTTETMLDGGWLVSGDTYFQDEDGYYVYEGRADDMMKVGGIWTSPIEIEGRLLEHDQVMEAAVVAREDDAGLTKPEAWIILTDKAAAGPELEAELTAHLKAGLAPYKFPRWWNFVDELPKTATGKIQRFKLRTE
jgi:benzoate-CoA ligase family protein